MSRTSCMLAWLGGTAFGAVVVGGIAVAVSNKPKTAAVSTSPPTATTTTTTSTSPSTLPPLPSTPAPGA